jgi:hypothetical protein
MVRSLMKEAIRMDYFFLSSERGAEVTVGRESESEFLVP